MNTVDFIGGISSAFRELFDADADLFDLGTDGINEQTLTFRLGLYLAGSFRDYDVDCEYNRLWDGKKSCIQLGIGWMKPDIIVHMRQSDMQNLFCIEAKKERDWPDLKTTPDDVKRKLMALTHPSEAYRYSLGLAWRVSPSPNPALHRAEWFLKGNRRLRTGLSDFGAELTDALDRYGRVSID